MIDTPDDEGARVSPYMGGTKIRIWGVEDLAALIYGGPNNRIWGAERRTFVSPYAGGSF